MESVQSNRRADTTFQALGARESAHENIGEPLWNRTVSGSVLDEPSSKIVPYTQPTPASAPILWAPMDWEF
jgi:hypothetical protein